MARRGHYRRSGYSRSSGYKRTGVDFAMDHIAAAKALSKTLGGTDKDVKEYFFSLGSHQLRPILEEYKSKYGEKAYDYAVETIPKWRTNAVQMSGQTAERLYNLLPPRMPLEKKYQLTENLWRTLGPASEQYVTCGFDATVDEIMNVAGVQISNSVMNFNIPEDLERRFNWISSGDIGIKQKILNHLQETEKHVALAQARMSLYALKGHISSDQGAHVSRATHTIQVNKHKLVITFDPRETGVRQGRPIPAPSGFDGGAPWGFIILVAIALFIAVQYFSR